MKLKKSKLEKEIFNPIAKVFNRNASARASLCAYLSKYHRKGIQVFEIKRYLMPKPGDRASPTWIVGHLIVEWFENWTHWKQEKKKK